VLIPKLLPTASPRRIARFGFGALVGGTSLLLVLLHFGDGPAVVTGPLLLAGLGAGALASQLANVAVSSVPQERSGEVGGLQNTATNLGASIATALAGAVLVSELTSSFMIGLAGNPDVPAEVIAAAETELVAGVPFLSDAQLVAALEQTELSPAVVDEILEVNTDARIEALRRTLGVLVLIGVGALFVGRRLPDRQPSLSPQTEPIAG
jgi:MFS family permease